MSQKFRAPRRRVESFFSKINTTITTSATSNILHSAEDSKTLVRSIINLTLTRLDGALSPAFFNLQIVHEPQGANIVTGGVAAALDAIRPTGLVWDFVGHADRESAIGETVAYRIDVDLKSMRKMKEGDTMVLQTIGDVAASFTISGSITQFFKE